MTLATNGEALADVLNAPCNAADAERLRAHVRQSHPSLIDPVVGGPLPSSDLSRVPNAVLAAVHTANHMQTWRDHGVDDWSAAPAPD